MRCAHEKALWAGRIAVKLPSMQIGDEDIALIEEVNRRSGAGLRALDRAAKGTLGGALFVEWPDGHAGVITHYLGTLAEAERTADVLRYTRDRGLPVPRPELVLGLGEHVIMVQERMPGSPPDIVTPAVVDAIVALNDRFADVLADRPDVPVLRLCLQASGDPYPRHEVLAEHSERSRKILDAIIEVGREDPGELTGTDLVHIDLTSPNVLFDQSGVITGVVDWNLGAYRGDRHLSLVKTRFEMEWSVHAPNPDPVELAATAHLERILTERIAPTTLRKYWAHRILYQLHFALQFAPPEVLAWHLEVAESRLL